MGAMKEQAKGVGQQIKGKIKEETRDAVGDRGLEIRGKAKKLEGQTRQNVARSVETAKGAVREAKGAFKEDVGREAGEVRQESEGRAERLSGQAKKDANSRR